MFSAKSNIRVHEKHSPFRGLFAATVRRIPLAISSVAHARPLPGLARIAPVGGLGRTARLRTGLAGSLLILAIVALEPACAQSNAKAVIVNGQVLSAETVRALEAAYRVPIVPGTYWYDAVSGAWGTEGGPIAGQLMPGLHLGGPLRSNASRGNTQVFVNGRELTAGEVLGLQQACRTAVYRGRYWVNAQGLGGYEGGPPIFNLAACGSSSRSSGGSSTRTYCDAAGNCSSHGLWGWIGTTR